MLSVRNILLVTLGMYVFNFNTPLQMISGGDCAGSSIKDEDINLYTIRKEGGNDITYFKYAMIVYCRAVAFKMKISREVIPNLKDLDEFDDSEPMLKFRDTRYKNLINIALKVLNEYHAAIVESKKQNSLTYIQKAFYYRALHWLQVKMKKKEYENNSDYKRLAEAVEDYLKTDVAINYLSEILPHELFQSNDIEGRSYGAQTISGLQKIALNDDAAVDLFLKIKSKGFEATKLVNSEDVKVPQFTYELMLQTASTLPEKFKEIFNLEPYEMLMYADYVYDMKKVESEHTKEVFDNDLKISDIAKNGGASWKYALDSFHRNLQRLFPEYVKVDPTIIKFLEHLLYSSNMYPIRLRCISFLYGKIIPEIERQMGAIDYSTPELQIKRVYYDRILAWLNHEFSKESYKKWAMSVLEKKNNQVEIYNSLQEITPRLEKIIQREKKENYIIKLFSLDIADTIETIDKIGDLETMGQDESRVLSLFFEFANSEEITNVAEHGLIWDLKHEKVYEKMLQDANSEDFAKKFGMKPFQMLMRMDYALYSQNHGLYESQENYLKKFDVQDITEGTLMRWKYAMIFFYRAVEMNLLENEAIDSINTKLLVYQSDDDFPRKLRSSCLAFLCIHILAEIDERIQDKGVHLGDNPTPETYHEGIFELIYPEPTGNGPKQWPSKEQRDSGIDETFRDILNKIRAFRVATKDDSGLMKIVLDGLVIHLKQKIRSTLM